MVLRSTIERWIQASRWRKAIRIFDRQIKAAQAAHAPVAHLVFARQQFVHECLRRSVQS